MYEIKFDYIDSFKAYATCNGSDQCIKAEKWCDGTENCVNGADESDCDIDLDEMCGEDLGMHLKFTMQYVLYLQIKTFEKWHWVLLFISLYIYMLSILNNMLTALDRPNTAVLVANLDMSAAFDTVNHEVLFLRLKNTFGIHDMALN